MPGGEQDDHAPTLLAAGRVDDHANAAGQVAPHAHQQPAQAQLDQVRAAAQPDLVHPAAGEPPGQRVRQFVTHDRDDHSEHDQEEVAGQVRRPEPGPAA